MGVNRIGKYESQWEGLSHILWKHRKCSKAPTRKYFLWGGNSTSLKQQTSQAPGFLTAISPIFGPPAVILFIIDLQTRPCTEDTGSLWGSETSTLECAYNLGSS